MAAFFVPGCFFYVAFGASGEECLPRLTMTKKTAAPIKRARAGAFRVPETFGMHRRSGSSSPRMV